LLKFKVFVNRRYQFTPWCAGRIIFTSVIQEE
jgi:hypothetical protein